MTRGRTYTWDGLVRKMTPASPSTGSRLVPSKTIRVHAATGPDHHRPDSSMANRAPINAVTASNGMIQSRRTIVASGTPETRWAAAR